MTASWRRAEVPDTVGLGARAAAFLVDVLLASGIFVLLAGAFLAVTGTVGSLSDRADLVALLLPVLYSYFPVLLVYFTVAEGRYRRTPGKQLVDIEVRRLDGEEATLLDSFIRNVLRFWFVPFLGIHPLLGVLLVVVEVGSIHVGEVDQRIGDLGAETVVVEAG